MTARPLWILLLAGALVFAASCDDDGEGGDVILPPPLIPEVDCVPDNPNPGPASVTTQCGAVNGAVVSIDIIVTDSPPGEEVVSIVLDLNFTPQVGTFVVAVESCTAGPALGPNVLVDCTVAGSSPTELLAVVSRQDPGPGVPIVGSQAVMTVQFRVTGIGDSPLTFLLPNNLNGSALLRRSAADPSVLEVIGGVTFAGATVSGS